MYMKVENLVKIKSYADLKGGYSTLDMEAY